MDNSPVVTARARYEELETLRRPYLEMARECSRLTIPSLIPPEGHSGGSKLYRPYQSTGADGVNNLAAKLLMAMFPPGVQFFRLTMDDYMVDQLSQNAEGKDARAAFETALGRIERAVVNRMEQKGSRKSHFEAILHLIVGGNGLLYVEPDGGQRFFPLSRYVVLRDTSDNVLEIVVKECMDKSAAPDEVRKLADTSTEESSKDEQEIEVYTWVRRDAKVGWKVHQEVCGQIVEGSEGTYPADKSAWLPLRWTKMAGEHYGRGRCEEYRGDLYSLEKLTEAIVRYAGVASKVIGFAQRGGTVDLDELTDAESGDMLEGDAKEITFLGIDKHHDFGVANSVAQETKQRLERAFLMASSWQRNAERVTAEEVRIVAGELEQGLGGVYSVQSEEFQRPLVTRLLHQLSRDKTSGIPKLPAGTVAPQIITGLDGLGRNTDLYRLDAFIQGTAAQVGQEALAQYLNVGAYMERRAAALGIDVTGLVKSTEEVQQDQQQHQMASMAEKLGGPAINAMSQQALAQQNTTGEN